MAGSVSMFLCRRPLCHSLQLQRWQAPLSQLHGQTRGWHERNQPSTEPPWPARPAVRQRPRPSQSQRHPTASLSSCRPTSQRRPPWRSTGPAGPEPTLSPGTRLQRRASSGLPDLDRVATLATDAQARLLSHPGVPSESETAMALRICGEAADLIMDASVQPQLSSIDHHADTAASTLLSLEAKQAREAKQTKQTKQAGETRPVELTPRLRDVIGQISDAAYAILVDPRVAITPRLLAQYVDIQARLGRPGSLPHALALFATKPRGKNPRRLAAAVDADVAERALDAALAAKDLDAAVGVVECTYAAPATVRAKLLRRGFLPAFAALSVPLATYLLARQLAAVQQTLEDSTATAMASAGILAYIGCTATIGIVATTTANDQMRRVTWAPGTPLRERWLREDERAALDKVTCAFGFSDMHRYGEEEGVEFQALREYVMRKGMLVDQVEVLEGMSS